MWSKMCYVEKCGEICHVEKCFHMTDVSPWVMRNVEQICYVEKFHHMTDFSTGAIRNVENICYVEKLSCFVAKSVLSQLNKNCACGEKKTYIKYERQLKFLNFLECYDGAALQWWRKRLLWVFVVVVVCADKDDHQDLLKHPSGIYCEFVNNHWNVVSTHYISQLYIYYM